jgi:hypothetical protein
MSDGSLFSSRSWSGLRERAIPIRTSVSACRSPDLRLLGIPEEGRGLVFTSSRARGRLLDLGTSTIHRHGGRTYPPSNMRNELSSWAGTTVPGGSSVSKMKQRSHSRFKPNAPNHLLTAARLSRASRCDSRQAHTAHPFIHVDVSCPSSDGAVRHAGARQREAYGATSGAISFASRTPLTVVTFPGSGQLRLSDSGDADSTCVWLRGANGLSLRIPEPRPVVFADKGTALFAQLAAGRKATNCYPAGERSTWKASPQGHHPASERGRANVEPMIRFHSTPERQAVTAGVPLLVAAKNLDEARARRSGTIGQLGALLHRGRHPCAHRIQAYIRRDSAAGMNNGQARATTWGDEPVAQSK